MAEYATNPDTSIARGGVNAIGGMGVKVPSCSGLVVEQLMKFLEVDIDQPYPYPHTPSPTLLPLTTRWTSTT